MTSSKERPAAGGTAERGAGDLSQDQPQHSLEAQPPQRPDTPPSEERSVTVQLHAWTRTLEISGLRAAVLRRLIAAGPAGLRVADEPSVRDVRALAACVAWLRREGVSVATQRPRGGSTRYVLKARASIDESGE